MISHVFIQKGIFLPGQALKSANEKVTMNMIQNIVHKIDTCYNHKYIYHYNVLKEQLPHRNTICDANMKYILKKLKLYFSTVQLFQLFSIAFSE